MSNGWPGLKKAARAVTVREINSGRLGCRHAISIFERNLAWNTQTYENAETTTYYALRNARQLVSEQPCKLSRSSIIAQVFVPSHAGRPRVKAQSIASLETHHARPSQFLFPAT